MHSINVRRLLAALLTVAGVLIVHPLCAEEQTARFRVIGLFEADREKDLRAALEHLPDFKLTELDIVNAEATVRFDAKRLLPNANLKKPPKEEEVLQRLNNLLQEPTHGTFRFAPLGSVPKEKLSRIEIGLAIHDCRGCRYGVYLALLRVDGVDHATVTSKPSIALIWIDETKTTRAALEAALTKARVPLASAP